MRFLATLFAACALLFAAAPAAAKSYAVDRIENDVVVDSDGTLRITEQITFRYKGRYKFAYRNIPLKPGERLSDVRVSEGGTEYVQSRSKRAGNFRVEPREGEQRITWYYRARNESRTFTIRYALSGSAKRHPDVAEVYVQFVGDQWDRPIGEVRSRLHLPDGVDPADVRAWAQGPLHGSVSGVGTRELVFAVAPLPAHTFWEGRVVMSQNTFGALPVVGTVPRLETILAEEAAWVREANLRRESDRLRAAEEAREAAEREAKRIPFLIIASGLGVLAMGVWFLIYLPHGKPHEVSPRTAPGEVPGAPSPALLSYLLHRSVRTPAVVATLLDLAQRGYFEIREKPVVRSGSLGRSSTESDFLFERTKKNASDLAPHESDLLSVLLSEAGGAQGFSMSQLKRVAGKNPTAFHRWFAAWSKRVQEAGTRAQWFEPYPVLPMALNAIMGVAVAIAGLFMCAYTDSPVGIPAIIGGVLQAFLTGALARRTPEGQRLSLEWSTFKRHLQSIAKGNGPVTLDSRSWGRYLAAAVVFGMHKEVLPSLRFAGGDGRDGVYPVWFHAVVFSDSRHGHSNLGASLTSMVDAVSSSVTSVSGTSGGGASAGGGGGSGGGGGGAG
jgi:uncharacterized membrane protein